MKELKPCPFCGNEEIFINYFSANWVVYCCKCKVEIRNIDKQQAISTWNRRTNA